jgi:hypothetical protein
VDTSSAQERSSRPMAAKKKSPAKRKKEKEPTEQKKPTWSVENRQEHESVLELCLCWKNWNPGRSDYDLGLDRYFDVCDNGEPVGLTFAAQVKSVKALARIRGGVKYRLKVKHLKRWEDHNVPILVVVWGIEERDGCWLDVPAILKWLDANKKSWRELRKSLTVPIPREHTCRGDGQEGVRARLVELDLPRLAATSPMTVKVRYLGDRSTPEGKAHAALLSGQAFRLKPLRLPGSLVQLTYPPAYDRKRGPKAAAAPLEYI